MNAAETADPSTVPAVTAPLFEERPGIPLWAAAAVVAGCCAIAAVYVVFLGVPDVPGAVFGLCFLLAIATYTLWTNGRRRIVVDGEFLRVGRREPVPLAAVEGYGILSGKPLRKMRSILFWPSPSGKAFAGMAASALAGAWGSVSLISGLSATRTRYGWCVRSGCGTASSSTRPMSRSAADGRRRCGCRIYG